MVKVISPKLDEAFYRTEYVPKAVEAIKVIDVIDAIRACGFALG